MQNRHFRTDCWRVQTKRRALPLVQAVVWVPRPNCVAADQKQLVHSPALSWPKLVPERTGAFSDSLAGTAGHLYVMSDGKVEVRPVASISATKGGSRHSDLRTLGERVHRRMAGSNPNLPALYLVRMIKSVNSGGSSPSGWPWVSITSCNPRCEIGIIFQKKLRLVLLCTEARDR